MECVLVTLRYGSSSVPEHKPYLVFLQAGQPRDQYLEARGEFERAGYLITGETSITVPDGSVDLNIVYAE